MVFTHLNQTDTELETESLITAKKAFILRSREMLQDAPAIIGHLLQDVPVSSIHILTCFLIHSLKQNWGQNKSK